MLKEKPAYDELEQENKTLKARVGALEKSCEALREENRKYRSTNVFYLFLNHVSFVRLL